MAPNQLGRLSQYGGSYYNLGIKVSPQKYYNEKAKGSQFENTTLVELKISYELNKIYLN
jgi:hypothetical protein